MTANTNHKCLKLALQLGFRVEGILSHYGDNGEDMIIMGLHKEQSKF